MLDLSPPSVLSWRASRRDKHLAQDLDPFAAPETAPDVAHALMALGTALDEARRGTPTELATALQSGEAGDILQTLMANLGPVRMTRLLDWLSEPEMPRREAVLQSLLSPRPKEPAGKLRAALTALNRRLLLAQLFANERVLSLAAAQRSLAQGVPA